MLSKGVGNGSGGCCIERLFLLAKRVYWNNSIDITDQKRQHYYRKVKAYLVALFLMVVYIWHSPASKRAERILAQHSTKQAVDQHVEHRVLRCGLMWAMRDCAYHIGELLFRGVCFQR